MKLAFADCSLDISGHRIERGGEDVHVEPQVFDLLVALARAAPDMLSYDAMIEQVWGGRIVSDATLSARISAARAAVGDSGKAQAVIRTIPRRGVQMAVPVQVVDEEPGQPASAPTEPPVQKIRYVTSDDGTGIAFAISGSGGAPLLRGGHWLSHLEHDWTSVVWRPWHEALGQGRTLIRYDPRGTGLSDRDPPRMELDDLVADMAAVATASGHTPVDIFAASQSVPVALRFAAQNPDRVRRMVLVNGFSRGSLVRGDVAETEAIVAMIRSGWGVPGSPFVKAIATLFIPTATPEEIQSFIDMQLVSASAERAAQIRAAIGAFDVTEDLPNVRAPVLVMSSEGDAIQPTSQSREIARGVPNAEFHLLKTASHAIAPSDPAFTDLIAAVNRFLAD